jgi:aldehyde:ferredoxin oxidoreductase
VFGAHYDTPPRMPAFLIKSVLFFNIVSFLIFLTLIILTIFSVPPLITFTIYMLGLLYSLGLLAIANKYNFNDNTSGVLTLLYLMKKLENKKIAYVFFDNEEKGLIGSMQLAQIMKKSKINMNQKKYIIFDCVGRGKFFGLLSYGNRNVAKKIKDAYLELNIENYSLDLRKPSFFEMSDHVSFKNFNQVGIMCYNRVDKKFILNDIHSHKDNYIDLNNIEVLSKIIEKYLNQGGNYE